MAYATGGRSLVLVLALLAPSVLINTSAVASQQTLQPVDELAAKLSEAKTDAERAALLDAGKELVTAELNTKLKAQGTLFLSQRQWLQANNTFLAMKEVATRLSDKDSMGGSLRGLGRGFIRAKQGRAGNRVLQAKPGCMSGRQQQRQFRLQKRHE